MGWWSSSSWQGWNGCPPGWRGACVEAGTDWGAGLGLHYADDLYMLAVGNSTEQQLGDVCTAKGTFIFMQTFAL